MTVKTFTVVINDKERTGVPTLKKAIDLWNNGTYGLSDATGGIKHGESWIFQVGPHSVYLFSGLAQLTA